MSDVTPSVVSEEEASQKVEHSLYAWVSFDPLEKVYGIPAFIMNVPGQPPGAMALAFLSYEQAMQHQELAQQVANQTNKAIALVGSDALGLKHTLEPQRIIRPAMPGVPLGRAKVSKSG